MPADAALMLGGLTLFVTFGFMALELPESAKGNEYSETLHSIGRVMWPVGLVLMVAGAIWTLSRLF